MLVLAPHDLAALHRLGRVSLSARHAVEGLLGGRHRSHRRGFAIEFAGHREYQPGDDLRHLDWAVWARSDRLEIRQHDEESRLRVLIVVDGSGSMDYGDRWQRTKAVAAALTWMTAHRRDAVGMAVVGDGIRWLVPPGSGTGQVMRIFDQLDQETPSGVSYLGAGLEALASRLRHRGVTIVISDCLDQPQPLARGLAHLRHRRQETRLLVMRHRDEEQFTMTGNATLIGLEGERPLRLDADRSASLIRTALLNHRREVQTVASGAGAQVLWSRCDEPLLTVLQRCIGAA